MYVCSTREMVTGYGASASVTGVTGIDVRRVTTPSRLEYHNPRMLFPQASLSFEAEYHRLTALTVPAWTVAFHAGLTAGSGEAIGTVGLTRGRLEQ